MNLLSEALEIWLAAVRSENYAASELFCPGLAGVMEFGCNAAWTDVLGTMNDLIYFLARVLFMVTCGGQTIVTS